MDAGLGVAEVPDAGPRELQAGLWAFQVDGGVAGPFAVTGTSVPLEIGTAAQLQVQLPPLSDVRVRLFDEADRVLQSDDVLESVDGGLDVRIGLLQPLRPGSSYRLVVDAQTGALVRDAAGGLYSDLEVSLKVLGTPEPEPRPGKKPTRSKASKSKRR